jgi:hypothetical protein
VHITPLERIIVDGNHDDRERVGGGKRRFQGGLGAGSDNHVNLAPDQLPHALSHAFDLAVETDEFDCEALPLDVSEFAQPLNKRDPVRRGARSGRKHHANAQHLLLADRLKRPRSCCAAQCEYEFSPSDVDCHATLPPEVV